MWAVGRVEEQPAPSFVEEEDPHEPLQLPHPVVVQRGYFRPTLVFPIPDVGEVLTETEAPVDGSCLLRRESRPERVTGRRYGTRSRRETRGYHV